MTADDKNDERNKILHEFFIRYGAGARHLPKVDAGKHWNKIAWLLIILGSLGWIAFLLWNP